MPNVSPIAWLLLVWLGVTEPCIGATFNLETSKFLVGCFEDIAIYNNPSTVAHSSNNRSALFSMEILSKGVG